MSTVGWIILVVLLVPAIGLLIWIVLGESFLRIPSGRLALLLVRGRPTDKTLTPGLHFVPALRRRTVEIYPAVEMSFRAGGGAEPTDQPGLDSYGPTVEAFLGDRARATIGYTVRYRLLPERLRIVHERFGPGGLSGVIRDESAAVLITVLGRAGVGVDDLFGDARQEQQHLVSEELAQTLEAAGIELTGFWFRSIDLGRTGEVIQTIARSRHELEQENASAAVRQAAAENDRSLVGADTEGGDDAWRYRETELWRELVLRRENLNVTLPNGVGAGDPLRSAGPPPVIDPEPRG